MRLIDAEELKRSIAVSALIEDQKTLEQIIDEQPTIEERKMVSDEKWTKARGGWTNQPERKKGEWKRAYLDHEAMGERPSILYCSICNQCIAYPTNYCPNCGSYNGGE